MNSRWMTTAAGLLVAAAVAVSAEFAPPTATQLKDAAADSGKVAALVKDATPAQAAQVLSEVLAQVVALQLDEAALKARFGQVVGAVFPLFPGKSAELAEALGRAVKGNAALRGKAVVSAIQGAVVQASGEAGALAGKQFGIGFAGEKAGLTLPPPLATQYTGQRPR